MNESEDTTTSSASSTNAATTNRLPTTREPENPSPKGSPGRLHLLAATVLRGFEVNPDPWHKEFNEWRDALLGECPSPQMGKRGFENHNLVSLGMLLAWGYFAGQLGDALEEVSTTTTPSPSSTPSAEPTQLVLPGTEDRPLSKPTFTVLGADGQALIEGYK